MLHIISSQTRICKSLVQYLHYVQALYKLKINLIDPFWKVDFESFEDKACILIDISSDVFDTSQHALNILVANLVKIYNSNFKIFPFRINFKKIKEYSHKIIFNDTEFFLPAFFEVIDPLKFYEFYAKNFYKKNINNRYLFEKDFDSHKIKIASVISALVLLRGAYYSKEISKEIFICTFYKVISDYIKLNESFTFDKAEKVLQLLELKTPVKDDQLMLGNLIKTKNILFVDDHARLGWNNV